MEMVALNRVGANGNARVVAASAEAEEGLRKSIQAQGILQPLLLRRTPPDQSHAGQLPLQVVLGGRRYRAAQKVGLSEIPADIRDMSDAEVEQAQLAENIQRAPMHPIDEWRGVRSLIQDHGLTFEQAAGALGLDERATRRMERLARLDPAFLALCEIEMPSPEQLRVIAAAPAKLQASVAKGKDLISERGGQQDVHWHDIARRCEVARIARTVAIFDLDQAKGLAWDEDLFAQPGSDEQFTTADVNRFMELQAAALEAKVAELVKAKKRHQVAKMKGNTWEVAMPPGFQRVYHGEAEKLRKHETAFHVLKHDGTILVAFGVDTKASRAAEALKKAPDKGVAAREGDTVEDAGDDDDADGPGITDDAPAVKPPFTKEGMALIAKEKTEALGLAIGMAPPSAPDVLALLVLALCAENVSVRGYNARFVDLASKLLAPGGNRLDVPAEDICKIGLLAIARILNCGGISSVGSGEAAEWVGAAVGAGAVLARFDTEAFLKTATVAELKRAASEAGLLVGGSAKELRERLVGRAPAYRPETAVFGAPAPKVHGRD